MKEEKPMDINAIVIRFGFEEYEKIKNIAKEIAYGYGVDVSIATIEGEEIIEEEEI